MNSFSFLFLLNSLVLLTAPFTTDALKITITAPRSLSPFGARSPSLPPSYIAVAEHIKRKVRNQFADIVTVVDADVDTDVDTSNQTTSTPPDIALNFQGATPITGTLATLHVPPNPSLTSRVGSYTPGSPAGPPWSTAASDKRLYDYFHTLASRNTADDTTSPLLIVVNQLAETVPWVEHSIDPSWEKGPVRNAREFLGMVTKCGGCISRCLADPNCKACIDALNEIDTRDQVEAYRIITSFESSLLREFSQCILQRNNIFGCSSTVPLLPRVSPMGTFRGEPLTVEAANKILVGWLDDDSESLLAADERRPTSWVVACGANAAYDAFPSQNQIFYYDVNSKGERGRSLWYDPVFLVETIDGRVVWAKRHYKVRADPKLPGRYMFSVLDNGVTSLEQWTLLYAADDLEFAIFHYSGAASAVGLRYTGGLVCTRDGSQLSAATMEQVVEPILKGADIQVWELFVCNNDVTPPTPPPLGVYRDEVMKRLQ